MATQTLEARLVPEAAERSPEELLTELQSIRPPKTLPVIKIAQEKLAKKTPRWKKIQSVLNRTRTSSRHTDRRTVNLQKVENAPTLLQTSTATQNRAEPALEAAPPSRVSYHDSRL
jgi:hypothetical protein